MVSLGLLVSGFNIKMPCFGRQNWHVVPPWRMRSTVLQVHGSWQALKVVSRPAMPSRAADRNCRVPDPMLTTVNDSVRRDWLVGCLHLSRTDEQQVVMNYRRWFRRDVNGVDGGADGDGDDVGSADRQVNELGGGVRCSVGALGVPGLWLGGRQWSCFWKEKASHLEW